MTGVVARLSPLLSRFAIPLLPSPIRYPASHSFRRRKPDTSDMQPKSIWQHFFARSRAAEAHRSADFSRRTAFLLRRRGLLTSHRLSFRSYLTSIASAASAAKIMPRPSRSTDTIGLPAAPRINNRKEHRQAGTGRTHKGRNPVSSRQAAR